MAIGLPIVMTRLSELGETLSRERLVLDYVPGDSESLARCIEDVYRNPATKRRLQEHSRDWIASNRSISATTSPLLAFCAQPTRAADRVDHSDRRFCGRFLDAHRQQFELEDRPPAFRKETQSHLGRMLDAARRFLRRLA
jgi:hypothetical protein